jgi:NAD(P)-dependent dehydrogenase (short-subunit alcohol dehydrogenase family)
MHIKELYDLENKVVLVTGGAGKFGKSIVEAFAESNAIVIVASRSRIGCSQLAESYSNKGYKVYSLTYDQGDFDSIINLRKSIKRDFGKLDVFVNNAFSLPMLKYSDPISTWESSMKVNSTGMFYILREMSDLMNESGGGSIINISSMKAFYSPDFDLYSGTNMDSPPDYNFHKAGLIGLTKYLARYLSHQNIRVNSISPGGLFANQPKEFLEKYINKVPLKRMADNYDIKGVVVFLASSASRYITGIDILMDGGLHS